MTEESLFREIEQFLYREARLLDERRFSDWLELLTDDIRYRMATRGNRYQRISKSIAILDPSRYAEEDPAGDDEFAILDEDKTSLAGRVARLDTGMAWAEDPPSRTRHFISNIEVSPGAVAGEITVRCNFIVYKNRSEAEQDLYVGTRYDLLRRSESSWRIASRRLVLDQNVMLAKNISTFF
jgi:3-phenylpropionate/cinnamic acid dioxygenase small subunit